MMFRNLKASEIVAAAVAIFLALTLILTAGGALGASMAHAAPARAYVCGAEDDPAWAWSRCGNHRRGVVTVNGTPIVVGPCRFRRMMWHRHIDYLPMDYLRGDRWAMAHGCDR